MKTKLSKNKELKHQNRNMINIYNNNNIISYKLSSNIFKDDNIFFNRKNKLSNSLESKKNYYNENMITNTSSTISNEKENINLSFEKHNLSTSINRIKENLSKSKLSDRNKNKKNEPQNKKRLLIKVIKDKENTKKCFVICKIKNKKKLKSNIVNNDFINNNMYNKSKSLIHTNINVISTDYESDNDKNTIYKDKKGLNYNSKIKRNLTLIKNRTRSLFEKYDSIIRSRIFYKGSD